MILLLVIAAWILVLSVVAGLCVAARAGDLARLAQGPAPAGWGHAGASAQEPLEHLEISARANRRPVATAEPNAPLRRRDSVAA